MWGRGVRIFRNVLHDINFYIIHFNPTSILWVLWFLTGCVKSSEARNAFNETVVASSKKKILYRPQFKFMVETLCRNSQAIYCYGKTKDHSLLWFMEQDHTRHRYVCSFKEARVWTQPYYYFSVNLDHCLLSKEVSLTINFWFEVCFFLIFDGLAFDHHLTWW